MRQLSPQLYQQEAQRVAARYDEAVQLAEQAFTEELAKLVSHLTERLRRQRRRQAQSVFATARSRTCTSSSLASTLEHSLQRRARQSSGTHAAVGSRGRAASVARRFDAAPADRQSTSGRASGPRWFARRSAAPQHSSPGKVGQAMELIIDCSGRTSCICSEAINLAELGQLCIQRASYVEPDAQGRWLADLSPCRAQCSVRLPSGAKALAAEVAWLSEHWLCEKPAYLEKEPPRLLATVSSFEHPSYRGFPYLGIQDSQIFVFPHARDNLRAVRLPKSR